MYHKYTMERLRCPTNLQYLLCIKSPFGLALSLKSLAVYGYTKKWKVVLSPADPRKRSQYQEQSKYNDSVLNKLEEGKFKWLRRGFGPGGVR